MAFVTHAIVNRAATSCLKGHYLHLLGCAHKSLVVLQPRAIKASGSFLAQDLYLIQLVLQLHVILQGLICYARTLTSLLHVTSASLRETQCASLQAGPVAALSMSTLRQQPDFLRHIGACISRHTSSESQRSGGSDSLLQRWEDREKLAWQMMAEAHAMDILAVEAFMQPRAKPGEHTSSCFIRAILPDSRQQGMPLQLAASAASTWLCV